MISVASSKVAISPLLVDHPEVDIAAINSPSSTVLAGEFNSIESLICDLTTASIRFKRLAVSHPFHSRFMKPGVKKLADFLSTKDLNPPNLDIISCFTGSKLEATQAVDPGFWANQLVMPVQFDSALKFLTRENALHLLEVGPGKTLSQLATDQSPSSNTIITSGTAEEKTLLEAAGRLWCHGVEIAIGKTLETPSPAPFQRTSIPPYPFEKTRFWLTPGHDLKSEHLPVDQWFSASEWERTPSKESDPLSPDAVWLLSGSIDSQLLEILSALDIKNDRSKTLSSNLTPTGVVVILSEENGLSPVVQARDILVDIYSRYPREKIKIRFIGAPKQPAKLSESYQVSLSMMKGLILVARQEMPSLELGCIEIDDYSLLSGADFLADITSTSPDLFVAYRQGERFTHRFSSIKLPAPVGHPKMLQQDGLYLISGGTGRLGYLLANYLNQRVNARCILLGRTIPKSMPTHLQDFCEFQQCDVGLEQDVNRVAKTLANRKLVVNGIIHAAGNPNLIASVEETPADWPWPSICTKVEGARNLGKHFGSQSDWGLMISSLASQLGGLGYSEYAVANAGLDAVAIEITKKFRKPWITVNFDAIAFDDSHPSNWISMQELPLVLNRIFNVSSLHQVTVSTTPVEKRLAFFSDATDEVTQELTIVNRKGLSSTESMITSIWEQLLGYDNISLDDDYFDLGGDSLKAIRIIEALREQLNHPVPMTYLVEYPTVRQLADAIEGGEPSSSGRIVVPLNSVKGHHQLLLLPGTGGSVMYLTELARDLGGLGFECIGLQALGHDSKGLPRSAIEDIAADNLLTLGVIDPQEVTLIGHSLGSWTGLEMAKQLRDSNQKPPHLIVLDAAAPAERPTDELQGWSDSQWLQSAAENIFATFNLKNPLVDDQLIDRSWDDLISLLHLKMVEMNLLPEGSNSDFVGEIVGAFKSQSQIIYSPPAEKITDISLVRAKQQLASFVNGIPDVFIRDPAWGWFQYAAGNVKIETCEGNHLNMVSKANSASLAGCLKGCIDRFLDK
jgi:malonyl CoA-acyl carrier protein transacylase/thioesterase domain-containing protein